MSHQLSVTLLHPKATLDHLGIVPHWLNPNDDRPAAQQIDSHYQHGGGWRPMRGFELRDRARGVLVFPVKDPEDGEDEVFEPFAAMMFGREMIFAYRHAIFAIVQPDGSFEVGRLN